MKIAEIRKLDIQKLNEALADLRNKSRELRFSIANNQLSAVRDLRKTKKDIAKIITILNEKRVVTEDSKAEKVSEDKKEKK
ncbi:50S ribosomal protein L29 [Candidatus Parcubacteria bacterium]|jgi:large subunit ribosomal protein L29|nr:50S ribosomal protein L29 [Candidatus Parcubacteria bacterium]